MLQPIRHGFSNLANFRGRDRRGLFWPYAGAVVLLVLLLMTGAMMVEIGSTFSKMERFAAEHPEAVTVTRSSGS